MLYFGNIILEQKGYVNDDIITLNDLKKEIFKMDSTLATTITDTEILRYRDIAIDKVEKLIKTSIVNSDYTLYLGTYANTRQTTYYNSAGFIVKKPFVNSIESIEYKTEGTYEILDDALYQIDNKVVETEIIFKNETLPKHDVFDSYVLDLKAIKVSFKSGVSVDTDNVNQTIKGAIISYVIEAYNGCNEKDLISKLKTDITEYILPSYS